MALQSLPGDGNSDAPLTHKPLFYKTCHGAHVGDIFMSLIYTCELCGANPFDYLTELKRHAGELRTAPQNWMPWNYRQTLDSAAATPAAAP